MPLSEHEQKILEEIERQLYEQDPKFARNVASKAAKGHSARNLRRGIGLFLLSSGERLLNEAPVTFQIGIDALQHGVAYKELPARRLLLFMGLVENGHGLKAGGK